MCQLVPLPSSATPVSVGLVPRFLERARAPAASNPPMAEGGNHRVSKSWRQSSTAWMLGGWVVTLETSHNPPGDVRMAIE